MNRNKIDYSKDYTLSKDELETQKKEKFEYSPKISIVVPIYNTNEIYLREMIESILYQSYSNWELCLYNGGSTNNNLETIILQFKQNDARIIYASSSENKGIAENTNCALMLSSGDYIGLLDHDDILAPNALYECVKVINNCYPDILYSDEDKITSNGHKHVDVHKKPDWSPDTLLSYNYICHFLVFRKDLINIIGLFNKSFDGSQDYDYILRLTLNSKKIVHLPKVLYHWRISETSTANNFMTKDYALNAGKEVLQSFINSKNIKATIKNGEFFGSYNICYEEWSNHEKVIIIAVGSWNNDIELNKYYREISLITDYENYEIILLNDKISTEYKLNDYCKVIGTSGETYPTFMNKILRTISCEFILIVDSNIKILQKNWCQMLISEAIDEHVAIVAPKIIDVKNKISSFGLAITNNEIYDIFNGYNRNFYGYFGRLKIKQNVTAVCPYLLLLKRSVLIENDYLNSNYESSISFLDYCLRVQLKDKFVKIIPQELGQITSSSNINTLWVQDEVNRLLGLNKHLLTARDRFYPIEVI
jgi:glycosyltransferase involved in cell wall biosynthesis